MNERRISAHTRKLVAERARECCEYCQSQLRFSGDPFVIEHILPLSRGGTSALHNLAFACQGCNGFKYDKIMGYDPLTEELVSLFHPRTDTWSEHFAWSEDFTLVVGLTPTGRATVVTLQLNREGLVNFRKVLFAAGEHPPKR